MKVTAKQAAVILMPVLRKAPNVVRHFMGHILKLILTLLILTNTSISKAGIGMGDWACTTPAKNYINNFSGKSLYLGDGKQVDDLSRWFFYNGFVIGQFGNDKY